MATVKPRQRQMLDGASGRVARPIPLASLGPLALAMPIASLAGYRKLEYAAVLSAFGALAYNCAKFHERAMMAMDELDGKLITLLQSDGRASNIELAKRAGVSEGTIRRRFRNLIRDEVIRVVAIPDPSKLGRGTTALIGLQVDPALVESIASDLSRLAEVQYAAVTTGAYDIFIWVALRSPEELSTFLRIEVGSIPGVQRTETFVNLSIKKNPAGPSTLAVTLTTDSKTGKGSDRLRSRS